MKRIGSSDSLGAFMRICPASEEQSSRDKYMYGRELQWMVEGVEEAPEKKKRLRGEQVRALEKNFEEENKLDPERKVKLAEQLGLQPRQVAVWFQNRRARCKTKQLERDYGLLKSNFDALQLNFDTLLRDNQALLLEIKELKTKLNEDDPTGSNISIKKDPAVSKPDIKPIEPHPIGSSFAGCDLSKKGQISSIFAADFKDGQSDSDTSVILNEGNTSPNAPTSSRSFQFNGGATAPTASPVSGNCCFRLSYQAEIVKMEEENLFDGEEACNLFSDEQAPSLHWYCAPDHQWT